WWGRGAQGGRVVQLAPRAVTNIRGWEWPLRSYAQTGPSSAQVQTGFSKRVRGGQEQVSADKGAGRDVGRAARPIKGEPQRASTSPRSARSEGPNCVASVQPRRPPFRALGARPDAQGLPPGADGVGGDAPVVPDCQPRLSADGCEQPLGDDDELGAPDGALADPTRGCGPRSGR